MDKKRKYFAKLKQTSIVLLLPLFMFLLLGPAEVFNSNITDFGFNIKDFIGIFIILFFCVWIVGSLLLSYLPIKANRICNTAIFTLSLLAYIQNMFLNGRLSGVAGNEIDWNQYSSTMIVNSMIWVIFFLGIFLTITIMKKYTDKISIYGSIFLTLIQLVAFISVLSNALNPKYDIEDYRLSAEGEYELAPNDNIIVFVLDATGSRVFNETLAEHPELVDGLEDFTYYTNYDPMYLPTYPAEIHMISGSEVNASIPHSEWTKETLTSKKCEDFYNTLHQSGYKFNMYYSVHNNVFGDISNIEGKVDNIERVKPTKDIKQLFIMMEKYSLFRYAPYVLKPRFEVREESFRDAIYYDSESEIGWHCVDVIEDLDAGGLTINNDLDNLLLYYHLDGIHGIWVIDKYGNRVPEVHYSPEYTGDVIQGNMVMIRKYIDELKRIGKYDDSTIIITADHGNVHDETDLQAIFFLKQAGEKHSEMQYNSAPICSCDYMASIMYFIGEDYSEYGTTYFDWKEGDQRERSTVVYDYGDTHTLNGYTYTGDSKDLDETIRDGYDFNLGDGVAW